MSSSIWNSLWPFVLLWNTLWRELKLSESVSLTLKLIKIVLISFLLLEIDDICIKDFIDGFRLIQDYVVFVKDNWNFGIGASILYKTLRWRLPFNLFNMKQVPRSAQCPFDISFGANFRLIRLTQAWHRLALSLPTEVLYQYTVEAKGQFICYIIQKSRFLTPFSFRMEFVWFSSRNNHWPSLALRYLWTELSGSKFKDF